MGSEPDVSSLNIGLTQKNWDKTDPVRFPGPDRRYVSFVRDFELPSPLAHAHISFTLASAAELAALRQSSLKSV